MKPPQLFPANHTPVRAGISSRVYQIEVTYTKAGEIVASFISSAPKLPAKAIQKPTATPNKNRQVANPPKLVQAAVLATIAPHSKITPARYFPIGNF